MSGVFRFGGEFRGLVWGSGGDVLFALLRLGGGV